jgi:hypothetical protein
VVHAAPHAAEIRARELILDGGKSATPVRRQSRRTGLLGSV